MSRKWFNDSVPTLTDNNSNNILKELSIKTISEVLEFYDKLSLREASQSILKLATSANLYLNETEPWKLIKEDKNNKFIPFHIYNVLETCRIIAMLIQPLLPNFSYRMLTQLNAEQQLINWTQNLKWGKLDFASNLPNPYPIITKIE